jgi:hypothetical protein
VSASRSGHGLCGSIGYRFDAEPETVVLCHCDDCQRHSGAAYSVNALVARNALKILHERPDLVIVKSGTLDDRAGLDPSADVWWRRAQDWLVPHPTRARFDGDAK